MKYINTLKKKYGFETSDFELTKSKYYEECNRAIESNFSIEKGEEEFIKICEVFGSIITIAADEAKIKETGKIYYADKKELIPSVSFVGDTTKLQQSIGLFRGFFIVIELRNAQNIKFMKDNFWNLLFKLSSLGEFSFQEIDPPTKSMRLKHPQLFNKSGNFFKLLRNYFLFETEENQVRRLGFIKLTWSNTTKFDDLIPLYCEAFELLYQMNFMLWLQEGKKKATI